MSNTPPLQNMLFAAVDLETTGLDPKQDQIIEIGIQIFDSANMMDQFSMLIDPHLDVGIPAHITDLTGITSDDLEGQPNIESVMSEVTKLLEGKIIVGHNIGFDLGFLSAAGFELTGSAFDTWELAYILDFDSPDYSLDTLLSRHNIYRAQAHRALDDAKATAELFLRLSDFIDNLSDSTIDIVKSLCIKASLPFDELFDSSVQLHALSPSKDPSEEKEQLRKIDLPNGGRDSTSDISNIFAPTGSLAAYLEHYEERETQREMAEHVYGALTDSTNLMVEAGTGTGKSLAYLIPALRFSESTGKRVIVSTRTLNLQDQLLNKDAPLSLAATDLPEFNEYRDPTVTVLKGRANYLCVRRFESAVSQSSIPRENGLLLAKCAVWMENTQTGDSSEMNINRKDAISLWRELSSEGAGLCQFASKECYLARARQKANNASVILTNHALLMADLVSGGGVLPEYSHLVIDEAHHLEDQATAAMGFQINQSSFRELVDRIRPQNANIRSANRLLQSVVTSASTRTLLEELFAELNSISVRLSETSSHTLLLASNFATLKLEAAARDSERVWRISQDDRDETFTPLKLAVQNTSLLLDESAGCVRKLNDLIHAEQLASPARDVINELTILISDLVDLRISIEEFADPPSESSVYWIDSSHARSGTSLNMAPIGVDQILSQDLFSEKSSVVLTSATLSTGGDFDHFCTRLGFTPDEEYRLDSPFNYAVSTQTLLVDDISNPGTARNPQEIIECIASTAIAAEGSTLALFTSNAAIKATYSALRARLQKHNILVLAQGISGTPHRLVRRMREEDRPVVLLGTSSLWEGIDIQGDRLQALIMTRLPFEVPTDPIFAARSETYGDSYAAFMEYSIPRAVIRFRQGFGRLIRSSTDRGVFVVLDSRILNRNYGKRFIAGLPDTSMKTCSMNEIGENTKTWLLN
ncbi:MAG: helicase C-terminal domain-containing protein [Chloroflexota bacterium]|nr:helicase C-terminal domain-containing protein [Chloroflexota bacterium]